MPRIAPFLILFLLVPAVAFAESFPVGAFSSHRDPTRYPDGWQPLEFDKIPIHSTYQLFPDENGTPVIRARTEGGASGILRPLDLDTKGYPVLRWRWKADNIIRKGDVTRKSGDDYPARVYVTFAYTPSWLSFADRLKFRTIKLIYGEYPPVAALTYVWANKARRGLEISNAYTDRVKMIVLQSGPENLGTWQLEEQNIREDFIRLFGKEPPKMSGIAIMTDGDNTGESATAWFGDLTLHSR